MAEIPQTNEERELLKHVHGLLKEGVKDRERHDKAWDTYISYASSRHWEADWTAGRSRPSINFCAKVIRSSTPLLVDRRPTFEVMPVAAEHEQLSSVFHACIQQILYKQRFQRKQARGMVVSQTVGTSFIEPVWDPDLNYQSGDVALRNVMPWDVLAIGGVDIDECEMVAVRRKVPIDRMPRLFPAKGNQVQPNLDPTQASHLPRMTFGQGSQYPITLTSAGRSETYSTNTKRGYGDGDCAWVWWVYFRDDQSYQATQNMLVDGIAKPVIINKLKYPGGWRMVVLSGNTILYDGQLPYKHLRVPLVKIGNYDIPGEFWSESDLQNIVQPNKVIDVILGQIIDAVRIGNNPPLLVPTGSGLNINNWINWPGIVAQYNGQFGAPHWMEPQKINPELFKILELCAQYIIDISGAAEFTDSPFSGASGELIAQIRESAMGRIRLKVQNMEDSLTQIGQQVVGLVQEFWTGHKMLRVSGLLPEEKLRALPNIRLDASGSAAFLPLNMHQPGSEIKLNDVTQGEFEVRVEPGSTLAKSHRQLLGDALAMKQAGVYDAEDVVMFLDDPRKDEVSRKMQQAKAMAQAGPPPKPGGPGPSPGPGPSLPQPPGVPPLPAPLPDDLSGAVKRI